MTPSAPAAGELQAPGLIRRLACLAYEGVLLFGVVMAAGLLYTAATRQHHALGGALALRVFVFAVLAVYFVWFWSRHGQTLAMRTWRVRLVTRIGQPVGRWRAFSRYLLSWLWVLPALATLHFSGLTGAWPVFTAMLAGVLAYAALAHLHPQRQFWHDAACGTRLVTWQAPARR